MEEVREIDLAYRILDDDLIDAAGRRCGKVDDLELTGEPGEPAHLSAILCGRAVLADRLPRRIRRLARRILGEPVLGRTLLRVPWQEVDDISAVVKLRKDAPELGLARGEREVESFVGKLPGA